MKAAAERGLRYSYCITSGNEPDLGLADYLNFVIDDPHTRQIVLFVEGIRRPQAFMHAAGRALALGKPILAIKTGATAQSQAPSRSPPNSARLRRGIPILTWWHGPRPCRERASRGAIPLRCDSCSTKPTSRSWPSAGSFSS